MIKKVAASSNSKKLSPFTRSIMTIQIPDQVHFDGKDYELAAVMGTNMCRPSDFGITAIGLCSACWRGYLNFYEYGNGELLLKEMWVNSNEPPPPINDNEAISPDASMFAPLPIFQYVYRNLAFKSKFTGNILIGRNLIKSRVPRVGFQDPISYKTVKELRIKDGNVLEILDTSAHMKRLRKEAKKCDQNKNSETQEGGKEWLATRFLLDTGSG